MVGITPKLPTLMEIDLSGLELNCEKGLKDQVMMNHLNLKSNPTFIMGSYLIFCRIWLWESFFPSAFLKEIQHIQLTASVHLTFTHVHALKKV